MQYGLWRAAALLLVMLINPFEIVDRSEETSRRVWQTIYAETYLQAARQPHDIRGEDPPGRRDIGIIMLEDADLDALGSDGGTDPFDVYDLIEQIRVAPMAGDTPGKPPRAIFVDLLLGSRAPEGQDKNSLTRWTDEEKDQCIRGRSANPASPFRCMLFLVGQVTGFDRWGTDASCQASPLAKLACIRRVGGLPVIFADSRDVTQAGRKVGDAGFDALGHVAILAPTFYDDPGRYQMVDPPTEAERRNREFRLHPAAILYAIHCLAEGRAEAKCPLSPVVEPTIDPEAPAWERQYWGWHPGFERPLEIIWGIGEESRFTRERENLAQGTEAGQCEAAQGRVGQIKTFVTMAFSGFNIAKRDRCIYTRTLYYRQFGRASPELLNLLIADKVVMIGLSSPSAYDSLETVPLGRVAGVYWHAMALDNLIVEGADYQKPAQKIFGMDITNYDVRNVFALVISLTLVGLGKKYLISRNLDLEKSPKSQFLTMVERILICLCLFCIIFLTVFWFTSQISVIPNQYNYAALTIMLLFEIFFLVPLILQPWQKTARGWLKRLGLAMLGVEETKVSPRSARKMGKGEGK